MKTKTLVLVLAAGLVGFAAGTGSRTEKRQAGEPVVAGHFDDLSLIPGAAAQDKSGAPLPFGYGAPDTPPLAPDAPPTAYWSIDEIRKAHGELAEKVSRLLKEPGQGSSQSYGGGPVNIQTRNFSIFMLYRAHREEPVLSLTKVKSLWDDAEQHAGAYDFYVITGGTGQILVGGRIANRQNLMDRDGPVPGEYRGQPVLGAKSYNVKPGDWLLIPPDTPHQPKPDAGGFSYMIMKINVGIYPWSLVR